MYNKLNELFPKTCVITTSKEEMDSIMDIFIKEKLEIKISGSEQSFLKSKTTCWYFDDSILQYSDKGFAIEEGYNIITPTEFINQYKQKTMKNFKNTVVVTGDVCLLKALLEKSIEIGWTLQDEDIPTNLLYFNSNEGDELKKNHVWWAHSTEKLSYDLPNDWNKVVELLKEEEKELIKTDDLVVCLPGYNNLDYGELRGGHGYCKGKILLVNRIDGNGIVWSEDCEGGIYLQALRLATPSEYKQYTSVQIGGYKSLVKDGQILYGCQSFNENELNVIDKLLDSPIEATISIINTQIDRGIIRKLRKLLEDETK